MSEKMVFQDKKTEKYLKKFGWSPSRKVALPAYIDVHATPAVVISILENLYGLEFVDPDGYKRVFRVHDEYIKDFEPDMQEWLDDTGLDFHFYPLGEMSEYGGLLILDQYGRFYLAGDELIYYGDNLEQFVDVVLFMRRSGISIRDNGTTFYCYNDKNTEYLFDVDKGWLGEQEYLSLEYIKSQN